jgi:lysophospholipase L1-like esterase
VNKNRQVFQLVLYSIGIYFVFSILALVFDIKWDAFEKVNLVSEVFTGSKKNGTTDLTQVSTDNTASITANDPASGKKNFLLYKQAGLITGFNQDTTKPALSNFLQKLDDLKKGKRKKIRIAYFGDSMIESDMMTQTFRKFLQQYFGGNGSGFVPVTSVAAKNRQTVDADYSRSWKDENFKNSPKNNNLFLSGHLYRSNGDWVQMHDKSIKDSNAIVEKSLICGYSALPISITVNNNPFTVRAEKTINRIPLINDNNQKIKISVPASVLPVYGMSFESETGIFVDNFTFRGITGVELGSIHTDFLSAIDQENPYDLIILQYGVNLLYNPKTKNFSWYSKLFLPVLKKLRSSFNKSEFIIVSTADRAFRYGTEYQSAIGIDSLVQLQAKLAYETGCSFYNQFATMGGTNSIVDWASRKPSMANKDYVHPNHLGTEVLGTWFYEAIIREYKKYTSTH